MSDAMTIAAAGVRANLSALSDAASAMVAATTPPAETHAPVPVAPSGFLLAYNPDAPFANLQDLVAVPNASPETATAGAIQAANGVRANLVVYRIASHLYRSLLKL
jgi:tripartite-type tricarboxylate transporter receptor subunit TctC